eukprot:COSAG06_NODE_324_length_17552_cov_11.946370_10_plen_1193_part_00
MAGQPPRGECAKEKPGAGTWPTRFVQIEGNSLNFYDKEGGAKRGSSISSVIGVSVEQGVENFTFSGQKSWFRVTLERRDHPSQPDLDGGGVTRFAFKSKHDSDVLSAALANMSAGRKWDEDAPMSHSQSGFAAAGAAAIAASRLSSGRTSISDPEVKWMWAGSGISQTLARKNPLRWSTGTASAAEHDLEATKSEPRGVEIRVGASDEINTFADQTEAQTFLQSLQKAQVPAAGSASDEMDATDASAPQSGSVSAVGPRVAGLSDMVVRLQVGGKGEFQVVSVSVDPAQISFRDHDGQLLRHAETTSATTSVPKSSRGAGHEFALRVDLSKPDSAGDKKHVLSVSSAAKMHQLQAALSSGATGSASMSSIGEGEDLQDLHEQPVVDHEALLSGGATCYRPGRIGLSEYTVKMRSNLQGIEFIPKGSGEVELINGDKLHSCKVSTSGENVRTQTLQTKKEFRYKLQLAYAAPESQEGEGVDQVYFNTQQECLCFARAIRNIAIGKHGDWSSCEHELDESNLKELHMWHSTTGKLGLTVMIGAHINLNLKNCILVDHDDWSAPRRLERAQGAGSRELDPRDLDLGSGVDSQPDMADLAKIKAVFDSLGTSPHDPPQLSLALVEYREGSCMWAPLSTHPAEEGVPPTEDANEGVPSSLQSDGAGSSSEQIPVLSNQSTPSLIIFGEADDAAREKMIQAAQAKEAEKKAEEKRREEKRRAEEKERKAKEKRDAEREAEKWAKEQREAAVRRDQELHKKKQRRMLMSACCALLTFCIVGLVVYAFIECKDASGDLTFPGGWMICEPPPPIDGCMNQTAYNYMVEAETQSDAINCTVAAEITLAGDIDSLLPRGFLDDHFRQDAIDDLQSITHDPSVRIISIRAGSTILTVEIADTSMVALGEAAVDGSASIAGALVLSAAVTTEPITFKWRQVDYQGTCGCGQPAVEFERQLTCLATQCDSAGQCVDAGSVANVASCPETTSEQAAWVGAVLRCPETPCAPDPAPPPPSTPDPAPDPAPPPPPTPGPAPEPEASCVDDQPTASCVEWAESGQCTITAENGPWVLEHCCATCHVVGPDVYGQTAGEAPPLECGTWSTLGATYPKCVAIDAEYEESGGLGGGMLALIIIAWVVFIIASIIAAGSGDGARGAEAGAGGCTCYLIPSQILGAMCVVVLASGLFLSLSLALALSVSLCIPSD